MIVDFISHSLNIFIDKVSCMFAVCCNNGMILGFDFLNVYFCTADCKNLTICSLVVFRFIGEERIHILFFKLPASLN